MTYRMRDRLKMTDDPLRLLYMWVKQGVIGLSEFKEMVEEHYTFKGLTLKDTPPK